MLIRLIMLNRSPQNTSRLSQSTGCLLYFIIQPGQTVSWRHYVLNLCVCLYVTKILKTDKPNGPWGKGTKWSYHLYGVRKWNIKVTRCWNRSQKSLSVRYSSRIILQIFTRCGRHTTVNAHYVTTVWIQKVSGQVQGHTRPKIRFRGLTGPCGSQALLF